MRLRSPSRYFQSILFINQNGGKIMENFTCSTNVILITPLPGVMENEMSKKPILEQLQKRKRR